VMANFSASLYFDSKALDHSRNFCMDMRDDVEDLHCPYSLYILTCFLDALTVFLFVLLLCCLFFFLTVNVDFVFNCSI